MKISKRVLVAMSGGVDSSVACHLIKKAGYECIGATIKTWPKDECERVGNKMCCSIDSISSARDVAHRLGVPHYVFDLSKIFKNLIRDYFVQEYENGRTPNPCIYCNSDIKFGALLVKAEELGCSYISSGHYARVVHDKKKRRFLLKKGKDLNKDQSYFLFNLKQDQLKRTLFPLGETTKQDVRVIAREIGLKTHDRRSSQDVCFEMPKSSKKPGKIIFTDGRILGEHTGISNYTIGQRKGLGVAFTEPLYVTGLDAKKNIVYVGVKRDTMKHVILADGVNWIDKKPAKKTFKGNAKIRYGSEAALARLTSLGKGKMRIEFTEAQSSPTPGQAVVIYRKDTVLGGGWIRDVEG